MLLVERDVGCEGRFVCGLEGKEPAATQARRHGLCGLALRYHLGQVGLGSVHGLASPLGAYFPIPHGVVCGTLVAAATEINIKAMQEREPENKALAKYAEVGRLLTGHPEMDDATAHLSLIALLAEMERTLGTTSTQWLWHDLRRFFADRRQ